MKRKLYDVTKLMTVANYADKVGKRRQTVHVSKKYRKVFIDGHCFVDVEETEKNLKNV